MRITSRIRQLYCDEVLSLLGESIVLGTFFQKDYHITIYRSTESFAGLSALGLLGRVLRFVLVGFVNFAALNMFFLCGVWKQKRYGLRFDITVTWYACGSLLCLLLIHPIAILIGIAVYTINYLLAIIFARPSPRPCTPQAELMDRIYGNTCVPYTIPPHLKAYYFYRGLYLKIYYCLGNHRLFSQAAEEISVIFDIANEYDLAKECVLVALKPLSRLKASQLLFDEFRLRLRLANIDVSRSAYREAEQNLVEIGNQKPERSKHQDWCLYYDLTLARLMKRTLRWSEAIDLYQSVRFEAVTWFSKHLLKGFSKTHQGRLYGNFLESADNNLAMIFHTLGRHGDAVDTLQDDVKLLERAGFGDVAITLRILTIFLRTRADLAPVTNDDYEEMMTAVHKQEQVLIEYWAELELSKAPEAADLITNLETRERTVTTTNAGHFIKSISPISRRWFRHLFAPGPAGHDVIFYYLMLALVSAWGVHRPERALDCISAARRISRTIQVGFEMVIFDLFQAIVFLRVNQCKEAEKLLGHIRADYSQLLLPILYCTLLDANVRLIGGGDFNDVLKILVGAEYAVRQIESNCAMNGVREARDLLDKNTVSTKCMRADVLEEAINFASTLAPALFLYYIGTGFGFLEKGNPRHSAARLKEGLDWLEESRITLERIGDVEWFKSRYSWVYEMSVTAYFDAGYYDRAVLVADRIHCLNLLLMSCYRVLDLKGTKDRRLLLNYRRLRRLILKLRQMYDDLENAALWQALEEKANKYGLVTDKESLADQLQMIEREMDRTVAQIRRAHPKLQQLRHSLMGDEAKLPRVPPGTVILYYHLTMRRIHIICLREDDIFGKLGGAQRISFVGLADLREHLNSAVVQFRDQLSSNTDSDHAMCLGQELYDWLILPIKDIISGSNRLYIVPDGSLFNLPFHTLPDEKGKPLLIHHQISYLPSLGLLTMMREPMSTKPASALVICAPDAEDDEERFPILEQAYHEADGLKNITEVAYFAGTEATKKVFQKECTRHDVIHIGAHAVFDDRFPLGSYIRFAGKSTSDTRLRAYEIISLDLNCILCNLSCCRSGYHHVSSQGEIESLGICFLVAGAGSVIASMWNIDDESTARIMGYFYDAWTPGSAAATLRAAQMRCLESPQFSHARFWAPFYVLEPL